MGGLTGCLTAVDTKHVLECAAPLISGTSVSPRLTSIRGVREPQAFDISPTSSPPLIRPLVPVSWLTLDGYMIFHWCTVVVISLCMLILPLEFNTLSWSVLEILNEPCAAELGGHALLSIIIINDIIVWDIEGGEQLHKYCSGFSKKHLKER